MRLCYALSLISRRCTARDFSSTTASRSPPTALGTCTAAKPKSPLSPDPDGLTRGSIAAAHNSHTQTVIYHYHIYALPGVPQRLPPSQRHPFRQPPPTSPWLYAGFGVACASAGYFTSGWLHSSAADGSPAYTNLALPSSASALPQWLHPKSWTFGRAQAASEDPDDAIVNRSILPLPAPSRAPPSLPADLPMSRTCISEAAARAAPAVVHLVVNSDKGLPTVMSRKYTGSGFIYEASGFILTNAHVVSGLQEQPGTSLLVTLQDGRMFQGRVLATDRASDLAVVKIDSDAPLPAAKLGCSAALRAGEWVVALGSPLLLRHSVTAGIISCVQRKGAELGLYSAATDYIQTDAAVNQGNSGGPLVNLDGEVVGISSLKAVAADGVSFAIPIDTAKAVVESLHRHGRVQRPYLGIKMCDLDAPRVQQLRRQWPAFPDIQHGVAVPQVVTGSPADKAGLRQGDVVVGWQGDGGLEPTAKRLVEVLQRSIGRPVELAVLRPAQGAGGRQERLNISVVPVEAAA